MKHNWSRRSGMHKFSVTPSYSIRHGYTLLLHRIEIMPETTETRIMRPTVLRK